MKPWVIVPAAAGVALLAVGVVAAKTGTQLKADEALPAPPSDPGLLPQHTRAGQAKATYCQLISAYRVELAKAEGRVTEAKRRMNQIETEARGVCKDFAWNATWTYKYGGPFGASGWTELKKDQPAGLKASCLDYVKGVSASPGKPSIRKPPTAGANFMDQSWHDVREAIVRLQHQVEDARALLPDLRRRYLAAKQEFDDAKAKVADLVKKIKDLQAQGVECGLA